MKFLCLPFHSPWILTHWDLHKRPNVFKWHFLKHFPKSILIKLLTSKGSNWQYSIGIGNGLVSWTGDKLLPRQWWPISLRRICITRAQWVNTLKPDQSGWNFNDNWHFQIHFPERKWSDWKKKNNWNIFLGVSLMINQKAKPWLFSRYRNQC